jgi:dTDP-4-dehydrorhamnose reductase
MKLLHKGKSVKPRSLITGARGTLGQVLCRTWETAGGAVHPWDRTIWSPLEPAAINACLEEFHPDVVFHLAIVSSPSGAEDEGRRINIEWPAHLAAACAASGIPFVYTSSAMVFSDGAPGPRFPETPPDRAEGYGLEKRQAEERVRSANPAARIARLGWQIGSAPEGNTMLRFFADRVAEGGVVKASRRWLPACSFLEDTAGGLIRLLDQPAGLYHLDSNRGWDFFTIASALSAAHGNTWPVEADDGFVCDQRLVEPRPEIRLPALHRRLALPRLAPG